MRRSLSLAGLVCIEASGASSEQREFFPRPPSEQHLCPALSKQSAAAARTVRRAEWAGGGGREEAKSFAYSPGRRRAELAKACTAASRRSPAPARPPSQAVRCTKAQPGIAGQPVVLATDFVSKFCVHRARPLACPLLAGRPLGTVHPADSKLIDAAARLARHPRPERRTGRAAHGLACCQAPPTFSASHEGLSARARIPVFPEPAELPGSLEHAPIVFAPMPTGR